MGLEGEGSGGEGEGSGVKEGGKWGLGTPARPLLNGITNLSIMVTNILPTDPPLLLRP